MATLRDLNIITGVREAEARLGGTKSQVGPHTTTPKRPLEAGR